MLSYKYLIIGAGQTAAAAVKGIRALDVSGSIGIIGQEPHPPYARPPLSKKLWQGKAEETIWQGTEKLAVTLHTGRRGVALDPVKREVRDNHGDCYRYEKLLLATGGTPRRLPFGDDDIIYFRTLDDYRRLRALADAGGNVTVIGGGFIGSEIAASLVQNGCKVTMIFPESTIGNRVFPADLAGFVTDYYREKGVTILSEMTVTGVQRSSSGLTATTADGREILSATIVAGLGIKLETELALAAGLPVDNGMTTDEFLRIGNPDIFAAGDIASFFNPLLGKRMRVEHEDNAVMMGTQAGRNMAGAEERYHYLPMFYSDLFDLGYEAVGELDSRLETVADWQEPYRKGVVYYLKDGRVRGVLLWNVWDQVDAAKKLIAEPGPFLPEDLKGRLPA